jgi:hypothetical protein
MCVQIGFPSRVFHLVVEFCHQTPQVVEHFILLIHPLEQYPDVFIDGLQQVGVVLCGLDGLLY